MDYELKFGHIPVNFQDRLSWMYDQYNITEAKADKIINKRNIG